MSKDFPNGPFFNFRVKDEFSFLKRLVWIIFGAKKIANDGDYQVTAYYFRGITFIRKIELAKDE